ncbi:hypothetical protein Tco_0131965, partial [Tanacetum coccineum]
GSTSNAHATVSAPMIITSVDEPVSQVEELSRNVHYLLRESGIKGKEAKKIRWRKRKKKKCVTELERMKECMEEMKGKWELMDYKYEMMADRLGWYDMDERSNDAIDVLKTYGTTPPPGLQDPSNDP